VKPAKVMFNEDQIAQRVEAIAATISRDFGNREIAVIGLLEDSFVFMADLVRKIEAKVLCYFLKADIEEDDESVCRIKKIFYSPELDIEGKNVLLVGGVLDTGITLDFLSRYVLHGGPDLLRICFLVDKPKARRVALHCDYVGFSIEVAEPMYLVGYGLAYNQLYRNLPYIGVLESGS
jgi:hypoxanthine phosphoribosyltransferase